MPVSMNRTTCMEDLWWFDFTLSRPPRITTRPQDRFFLTRYLRSRFLSAESTAKNIPELRRISGRTVRNRLKEHGLKPWRLCIRPVLKAHHKRNRLTRARQRQDWNREWNRIRFTDESRFCLQGDSPSKVYRGTGERYTEACICERDRMCVGSVVVWVGISHSGKPNLITVKMGI